MKKGEQLYEGKAKKVFATDDPDIVIVDYKDDATAFNGLKKGTIAGKGVINNKMSNMMFRIMEQHGIPTHYVEELSDRETAVKKVQIVPLEVIIRNTAAGSFSKRYGVPEGKKLPVTVFEFSYKNDELGDPLLNDYHALAMELATPEEIETIKRMAFKVNDVMKEFFATLNIDTSTLSSSSADSRGRSSLRTKFLPIPAVSGTRPRAKNWIKTDSGEISAV